MNNNINIESIDEFINSIKNAKKNGVAFFQKGVIKDIPSWQTFLQCLRDSTLIENIHVSSSANPNVKEVAFNSLLIKDTFYFSPHTKNEDVDKYFKEVSYLYNIINEKLGVIFDFRGPKISLADHDFGLHSDPLDAYAIHCHGKTKWIIESVSGELTEYDMEPGDFLFFPKEAKHGLFINEPRAGLIFFGDLSNNES